MTTRKITRIGLLTATIVTGRLMFAFLPNIQPMTTLLLLITLYLGYDEGLLVALLSLTVSNLYLGFGPWTLAQCVAFFFVISLMQLQVKLGFHSFRIYMALFAGLSGLFYGLMVSLVQAPFFGWLSFIPYYLSGLPYDVMHMIGNIGFWLILEPVFKRLFEKQKEMILD